jgi:hypothetical protein
MHLRYEEFAEKLIEALEKLYENEKVTEFTKKRNILRLMSELFLKGLFNDFKKVFKCLNHMFIISPQTNFDDF